jgi:hypothetical protein
VIQITQSGIESSDNPSILLATGETAWGLAPMPKANEPPILEHTSFRLMSMVASEGGGDAARKSKS